MKQSSNYQSNLICLVQKLLPKNNLIKDKLNCVCDLMMLKNFEIRFQNLQNIKSRLNTNQKYFDCQSRIAQVTDLIK